MENYDGLLTIEQLRRQEELYQQLSTATDLDTAYLAVEKLMKLPANGCVPHLRMIRALNIVSGSEFFPYIWTMITRRYPFPHWWDQAYLIVEVAPDEMVFMKQKWANNRLADDKYLNRAHDFFESDACQEAIDEWWQTQQ